MDKIIYSDSQEELLRSLSDRGEAIATLIDTEVGVKSAASQLISRSVLEDFRPTDDKHALIHLIAMGNSDQYGPNRNGDYFAGDVLEKRANTFVKFGHVFREHRNKDVAKRLGEIKYAAYDPKGMQRVELLIHLDKDRAPKEFEKVASGEPLNFSMSCRVPNDRCSCCGNEAKTVSKYCTHLRDHMGQWMPEFKKYAFAYNDQPTFFDISVVKTPADRIARHLEYMFKDDADGLKKAASEAGNGIIIPSAIAAMEEGVNLGRGYELEEQSMICKLAAAEQYAMDPDNASKVYMDKRANMMFSSFPFSMMESFTPTELESVRTASVGTLMRELAKRMCMMSFPSFCQYATGDPDIMMQPLARRAAMELPGSFQRIRIRIVMPHNPETETFRMSSGFMADQDPCLDKVQSIMDKAEAKFSMEPEHVSNRVTKKIMEKSGSFDAMDLIKKATSYGNVKQARLLADTYAEYQVRALCDMQALHGADSITDQMIDMTVGGNIARVYEP